MTTSQRNAILNMNEAQLRSQISVLSAGSHENRDELVKACENQLEALNVDCAMVEMSEVKVVEV